MNDLNTAPTPDLEISTDALAPGSAEFRADPVTPEPVETEKPMSLEDAVKQAAAETKEKAEKAEEPKPEAKAKPEPKAEKPAPERGENGKFTAKPKPEEESPAVASSEVDAEAGQERGEARPSEGRDITRAPARFLPRAQEQWANVPEDVRSEVYRTIENMEKGMEEYKADREFRKGLREFEDMAKGANTTIDAALRNYVRLDQELRSNPENALREILKTINITPEQYAAHIIGQQNLQKQNPQAYAQNQQNQQLQGQVQQLSQQLQHLTQAQQIAQQQAQVQHIENTLFNEVRQAHPRFDELRQDVAFFYNSDKLSSITDERRRLYEAVDMAERINPVGHASSPAPLNPAQNAQRPINPAGTKSVKGSPSYGAQAPHKSAKVSLDEAIKLAAASVPR